MKENSIFIKVNDSVREQLQFFKLKEMATQFAEDENLPVFIVDKPLVGEPDDYSYDFNMGVAILIPGYKLMFAKVDGVHSKNELFEDYVEDFTDDLSSLSDKFKHKQIIGKKREWRDLIACVNNVEDISSFNRMILKGPDKRKSELLISLITGSVNDAKRVGIEQPNNLLEAIKHKIVLFDVDQTRFIYNEKKGQNQLTIQGLAGTGKTELLLHKLVDLYIKDPTSKIVFTCFNKILANDMTKRIPDFFNFMKADKQIEWNKRLWSMRSWGSQADPNSGIYSYICARYNIPFSRFSYGISFGQLCESALSELDKLDDFSPCFDYVLIDEGQDFDDSFFELCKKVTSKQVIIASDIFQNVFDRDSKVTHHPDFTLNKVYRTDPKNFMFAQMIGFGVKEKRVINWLDDNTWKICGYSVQKENDVYKFTREPLQRFGDLPLDTEAKPLQIIQEKSDSQSDEVIESTLNVIGDIIEQNPKVKADDIGIVFLSGGKEMYHLANRLSMRIIDRFGWSTQKGYEIKRKDSDALFISNTNNIKGLEFPFLICIANDAIQSNPSMRNSLYMALTRSFITSYLVLSEVNKPLIDKYETMYEEIMETGIATVKKPDKSRVMSEDEISNIQSAGNTLLQNVEKWLKILGIDDPDVIKKVKIGTSALLPENSSMKQIKEAIDSALKIINGGD